VLVHVLPPSGDPEHLPALRSEHLERRTDQQHQEGVDSAGQLCGTLRRTPNSQTPVKGDEFRFVSVRTTGEDDGETKQQVVIYGAVVD